MTRILRAQLASLTATDVDQLCADQAAEGTELEFKSDLPSKAGRGADPWHAGDGIGEYARNEIAEEIIAFANTFGGIVCIGIDETADHPKRAQGPRPVPRAHELARRLRQAVHDIIDPPLPVLEAIGIEYGTVAGAGIVILRVPPSRRRPHRHHVSKEVFVRRADESARIPMREIQELTIQAASEAARVDILIKERREKSRDQTIEWLSTSHQPSESPWGGGAHFIGVPTTPIDLGRVVGRRELVTVAPTITARFPNQRETACEWPYWPNQHQWYPALRCILAEVQTAMGRNIRYSLQTNGICEISFRFKLSGDFPGISVSWLLAGLGFTLAWIERIRAEGGIATEYALATEIFLQAMPALLTEYGVRSYAEAGGITLPIGFHEFPVASIGPTDEFARHLQRFDEDVWNLAGQDIQRNAPIFSIAL
jgi:Putative DNA-binding domain